MKILVLRGGALGDFILTLPVFSALRRHFASARISVLGYPRIAQIALAEGLIDEIFPIESPALAAFFTNGATLDSRWCEFFRSFDAIISYIYDPEKILEANIKRCAKARFVAGPYRPDEQANQHATEVCLEPLAALGVQELDPVPRLSIQPSAAELLPEGLWLAVHPGSGSPGKNWPMDQWRQLLKRLAEETAWNFLVIAGEAEADRWESMYDQLQPDRRKLMLNQPLVQVAQTMRQCVFFMGHDSGISHLAAALGMDGLVLWGPSNRIIWQPRSDHFRVLESPVGLSGLSSEVVYNQLVARLPKG